MGTQRKIGEFRAWIEQETSIHVKAVTQYGDPIELSAEAARLIANMLIAMADELDELDSTPVDRFSP